MVPVRSHSSPQSWAGRRNTLCWVTPIYNRSRSTAAQGSRRARQEASGCAPGDARCSAEQHAELRHASAAAPPRVGPRLQQPAAAGILTARTTAGTHKWAPSCRHCQAGAYHQTQTHNVILAWSDLLCKNSALYKLAVGTSISCYHANT